MRDGSADPQADIEPSVVEESFHGMLLVDEEMATDASD
jgi:hypothetical protein